MNSFNWPRRQKREPIEETEKSFFFFFLGYNLCLFSALSSILRVPFRGSSVLFISGWGEIQFVVFARIKKRDFLRKISHFEEKISGVTLLGKYCL